MEVADGRAYVLESSANLRSCRMAEHFALHHDPGLLQFHRRWIESMLEQATRAKESPK